MTKTSVLTLAVVGDVVEDVVVWTRGPREHASDNPATIFHIRGGSAANVAVAASSQCHVRFIGRVGDDERGRALTAELSRLDIDVRVQREGTTGTIVVLVDEDGERTMFPDRGAAAELGAIDPSWLDGAAWVHIPLYGLTTAGSAAAIVQLVEHARTVQLPVSFDASSMSALRSVGRERIDELLWSMRPRAFFANADEAELLGLLEMQLPGGVSVVVKRGHRPVIVRTVDTTIEVPVPPVEQVLDSTGAGDAFAAGYLVAAMVGESASGAVLAGAELAATALHRPGALDR